jgi:hypothetical protein
MGKDQYVIFEEGTIHQKDLKAKARRLNLSQTK